MKKETWETIKSAIGIAGSLVLLGFLVFVMVWVHVKGNELNQQRVADARLIAPFFVLVDKAKKAENSYRLVFREAEVSEKTGRVRDTRNGVANEIMVDAQTHELFEKGKIYSSKEQPLAGIIGSMSRMSLEPEKRRKK